MLGQREQPCRGRRNIGDAARGPCSENVQLVLDARDGRLPDHGGRCGHHGGTVVGAPTVHRQRFGGERKIPGGESIF